MNRAIFLDKDGTLVEYNPYGEKPRAEDILNDILMESFLLSPLNGIE